MDSQIKFKYHFVGTCSRHVFRTRFGEDKKVKIMVSSRPYAHFQRSKGVKKDSQKASKNTPKPPKTIVKIESFCFHRFFSDFRARTSFRWANLKPSLFLSPTGQKTPPPRRQKAEKFAFFCFPNFFWIWFLDGFFEEKPPKMDSQIDQKSHFLVICSRHVFRTRFGEAKKVKISVSSRRYAHFQRSKGVKKDPQKASIKHSKTSKNDS